MTTQTKQPTCAERVTDELKGRIADLTRLWSAYQAGESDEPTTAEHIATHEDLGEFHDYGLAFDYVAPDTFNDQPEGYWRYQLSWGGPSDEFRFFASAPRSRPYCIEYRFMDWGDGAGVDLQLKDRELLEEIWGFFQEVGSVESEFTKAMED